MSNDRLREAIAARGLTVRDVAEDVVVDPKTVERWIALDRIPHPRHRAAVGRLLRLPERELWPALAGDRSVAVGDTELVGVFANRASVPHPLWDRVFRSPQVHIDVLAYAALFLTDQDPELAATLAGRAAAGAKVRLLLGDPDSAAVAHRGAEEGLGAGLAARIRISELNLAEAIGAPGVEFRRHATTLYNSMFRFDEEMLVNVHVYGFQAAQSPVLHLRRSPTGGLFDHYAASFDRVWASAVPAGENGVR